MHRFLSTVPFDLYELALFHLVVKHRSFTKAAEIAGLTQSAITRQMQGVENSLGIQLLPGVRLRAMRYGAMSSGSPSRSSESEGWSSGAVTLRGLPFIRVLAHGHHALLLSYRTGK